MGGVDDEHVGTGREQRLRALDCVRPDADRGADAQAALRILRRLRELDALRDVLDGDQPAQHAVVVDDRQLLDAVPVQQLLRLASVVPTGAVTRSRAVIRSETGCADVRARSAGRGW